MTIMKSYVKSDREILRQMWSHMSAASQTAVEFAVQEHDNGADWYDAIHHGVRRANEGNYEPEYEDESWYGNEANIDEVTNYIEIRYDVEV